MNSSTCVVPRPLPKSAVDEQRRSRAARQRRPADGAERCEPPRRQRRALAHGRDRRHAGRADRGPQAREQRHDDADERVRRRRSASAKTSPVFGSVKPTASKSLNEALAEPEPDEQPDDRREDAHHEPLDHDEPQHLAPRGAERAQRRELTRALGDRDRERVRDHERADEQRDTAEGEQEVCRKLMKLFVSFASLAAWALPLLHLGARRQDPRICADELVRRDARLRASTRIWSSLPFLSNSRCAVGRSKPASVAPPIVETRAELDEARDAHPFDRAVRLHADRLADLEVLLRCGRLRRSRPRRSSASAPPTSVSELNSGCVGSTLKPRFGAPPKTIALPFLPIRCASPPTPPIAASTSGSAFDLASSDSANGGAVVVPLLDEVERRLAGDRRRRCSR